LTQQLIEEYQNVGWQDAWPYEEAGLCLVDYTPLQFAEGLACACIAVQQSVLFI